MEIIETNKISRINKLKIYDETLSVYSILLSFSKKLTTFISFFIIQAF
ncbi:hypothetical protein DESAMIL20_1892 [Desulfurella amilsii]|uniref:Uncharacterized protein n=1 Tax=Desulfurella amilsii TaxID=1562698 RepID=A0A1X4XXS4_9BACT|nr:hypothetical protein DESAMIL20_1892 [Desulfurella amilsii]